MVKTIEEINERIKDGSVCVVTAEEMVDIVREKGTEKAAREVDVVTTGTFGAMCSSGAWFNFGHADPPIKMQRIWLNDVEAYTGVAAVDAYIGATQLSETKEMEYGGGHVIEDLVAGKSVELKATAYGTDCYPRKSIETTITLRDINQAIMLNPRNAYQRYVTATNSTDRTLYTYMGTLLPNLGNATYSGAGVLSPIFNDPQYETIGIGTRIFLCGTQGYVVGEGTQHDPGNNFGTLMVSGDLKKMKTEFCRGATFHKYGTTLYVGLGIPIPVLNEKIARNTAISDRDIVTNVLDYGVARRVRPILRKISYEELKSGKIEINGVEVPVSSLSSFNSARKVAEILKAWIGRGEFYLSKPAERIPLTSTFKPMKMTREAPLVRDVMSKQVSTIKIDTSIEQAARIIIKNEFNHLPVTSDDGKLIGIVTSWDISKAVALNKRNTIEPIMTKNVVTVTLEDPIDIAARKLEQHNISAVPVVDKEHKVVGIVTSEDLSKLFARRI